MARRMKSEFLVVGSGAGGATLARELARNGKEVLVVEKGIQPKRLGTQIAAFRIYDRHHISPFSSRNVSVFRGIGIGGSTLISGGNAVFSNKLGRELQTYGVDLDQEVAEALDDTKTRTMDERLLSRGSLAIGEAANKLGYQTRLMPKFIDSIKCHSCGNCMLGCSRGAKWTAANFIEEAVRTGAKVVTSTEVTQVMSRNGRVSHVKGKTPSGEIEIEADKVIVAAGALGTPLILQNSGFTKAGQGLFCDLFNITFGRTREAGINLLQEPSFSLLLDQFYETEGFIIMPCIYPWAGLFLLLGAEAFRVRRSKALALMTKIRDDRKGKVNIEGRVTKEITTGDKLKLERGAAISKEILIKAGCDPASIFTSRAAGAHPGGTAAIGEVVDHNLETEIRGLYVADASVLPFSPGLPPIIALIALSKKLAHYLLAK